MGFEQLSFEQPSKAGREDATLEKKRKEDELSKRIISLEETRDALQFLQSREEELERERGKAQEYKERKEGLEGIFLPNRMRLESLREDADSSVSDAKRAYEKQLEKVREMGIDIGPETNLKAKIKEVRSERERLIKERNNLWQTE